MVHGAIFDVCCLKVSLRFPKLPTMAMAPTSKRQRSGLLNSGNFVPSVPLRNGYLIFIFPALAIKQTHFPQEKQI